jgi:hypothetical protein
MATVLLLVGISLLLWDPDPHKSTEIAPRYQQAHTKPVPGERPGCHRAADRHKYFGINHLWRISHLGFGAAPGFRTPDGAV